MNWGIVVIVVVIGISLTLIGFTLGSLVKLGDERKNLIKMKAQSYSFAVVVFMMLINIFQNIYVTQWADGAYEGVNPFTFLVVISVVYLISLLFFKKKYGG